MKPPAALILGSSRDKKLANALFALGLAPIVRETMGSALTKLRYECFQLILVDRFRVDVDVLEFVLNARDLDEATPILIAGRSMDVEEDQALAGQAATTIVGAAPGTERFARAIEDVIEVRDGHDE